MTLTFTKHTDRENNIRTIRIQALQSISFASKIDREWDTIAREEVESGKQQRNGENRFEKGK